MRAALLMVGLLWAGSEARAQVAVSEPPKPERLYLNAGVLMGSSRVVALGGAYVGIAEGVAGFGNNLAALAQRSPDLDRDWDVGFTLSWLDLPLSKAEGKDLDNDGVADNAPETLQLQGAITLQYRNFGLGFSLRNYRVSYCNTAACDPSDYLRVSLLQSMLAGAVALGGRDDFILGFGIYSAQAILNHASEPNALYGNTGIALDMLYRPHGRPYRVGIAVRPEVVGAWQPTTGQEAMFAGRQLYSAVVSPGVLSLGASWRLGEGAELYNRMSPAARQQMLEGEYFAEVPPEENPKALAGRWLLSAQADVISSVERAVSVRSFTSQTDPVSVGGTAMVQLRLGVEHETWPGRLRTRLGTFIEPSPFEGVQPRPHLTGGFELFLFHYLEYWSVTASFDVSRLYSDFGVSVGFWR